MGQAPSRTFYLALPLGDGFSRFMRAAIGRPASCIQPIVLTAGEILLTEPIWMGSNCTSGFHLANHPQPTQSERGAIQ
ncbi:MAG: hypothetical protein ACK2TX_00955, partial [Anaerolineales bacterium]